MQLTLDHIRKEFDGKVAVNDLSLEVPEGVIYGIIGPNGAGKTTTIRMVMNITVPDRGRVLVDGRTAGPDFNNRVGYLPEERGLYKKMTLEEVILYMAELKGVGRREMLPKIGPWLERMNLAAYRHRKVEELSKGMAQKLQFVTTIIHEPEIVILDELFSGLDPINIELIKDILLEIKRSGRTILFSTHVMEQAEKLCDHVCMIAGGEKVLDGPLGRVKAQFGENTIQLEIEGDALFVGELPGVRNVTQFTNYIEIDLGDGARPNEILRAVTDRVPVRRFQIIEPSLYSIFIRMARPESDAAAAGGEAAHA
ncbi:MAG TPA: ATP-binding cassette domain-containing protein [candidate division Zixibacteria bacterium]|nr:ATP-binding cassette domain-containing protein [candidate division Zixibacteria bacterium]MDD4918662.1 ATP-binding cassette domain-containing protein [candidate division Zixibacteria bacterium]MDM7971724.1 ATP-binding cassette domain-containing protein [candidate division Zixibacteria bacterium]HOD66997.1 ATP-binding cassette domain-containing protein [candidate division Zixibacteria bacterium]HPC11431.1 ATP-binding cassette domain-containing protein [candidate division Zixibacteria bacteriu